MLRVLRMEVYEVNLNKNNQTFESAYALTLYLLFHDAFVKVVVHPGRSSEGNKLSNFQTELTFELSGSVSGHVQDASLAK